MPVFDLTFTSFRDTGAIAELFCTWPNVHHSNDSHSSFSLGEDFPLAQLYDLKAKILLLGTYRNHGLHVAEIRSGFCPMIQQSVPIQ